MESFSHFMNQLITIHEGIPNRVRTQKEHVVVGAGAKILQDLWYQNCKSGNQLSFIEQIQELVRDKESLPSIFLLEGGISKEANKRVPSFIESVHETTKRLSFIEALRKASIPPTLKGILYGGSMSYGKFYNVRGGKDASDVDLFYIVESDFFASEDLYNVFSFKHGFLPDQIQLLQDRSIQFLNLYRAGKADLMSQKLHTQDFVTSLKIMPISVFRDELTFSLLDTVASGQDVVFGIRDYKPGLYSTRVFTQYDFSHTPYYYSTTEEILADDTVVTTIPSYLVKDGHLYTGDHHNHFIPRYDILYDVNGCCEAIMREFHHILKNRSILEKQISKNPWMYEVINVQDRKSILSSQAFIAARERFG